MNYHAADKLNQEQKTCCIDATTPATIRKTSAI